MRQTLIIKLGTKALLNFCKKTHLLFLLNTSIFKCEIILENMQFTYHNVQIILVYTMDCVASV